jgi:hypothetical protein
MGMHDLQNHGVQIKTAGLAGCFYFRPEQLFWSSLDLTVCLMFIHGYRTKLTLKTSPQMNADKHGY